MTCTTNEPAQRVLDRLAGVRQVGDGRWMTRCPCHDDQHASLSVARGEDGRVVLYCHACGPDATPRIVERLGLRMADLFAERGGTRAALPPPPAGKPGSRAKTPGKRIYASAEAAIAAAAASAGGSVAGVWVYPGDALRVVRVALPDGGKAYRPVHPAGEGWAIGDPPGPLPLYRHGELPPDGPVVVVEGEKCADVAWEVCLPAVTSAHGAKSAGKSEWTPLAGRDVVILPDNDAPGRGYAEAVAAILTQLDPPAVVRIVDLPDLPEHGDLADWVDADGPMADKLPEEIREAILTLARQTPPFIPEVPSTSARQPPSVYRPFPVHCLPEPTRSFVRTVAEAIGCDPAYVALPLLSAVAAAIGNTRRIELKRGWTEPSILWTAIVGDSGTLKSPALELALRATRRRQREEIQRHTVAMEDHRADVLRYEMRLGDWRKSGGDGDPPAEPQAPPLARCWCDDTTIEALALLLAENPRGLLLARDELAGWLGGFDRYAKGKGGDAPKWLEFFGGRSVMVDRKSGDRKVIHIPHAAVSVTGGIQPGALQRALGREYFENGLAARILLACPPRRAKRWTDAAIAPEIEQSVVDLIDRLYAIEPAVGADGGPEPLIVRLASRASEAWIHFYNEHADEQIGLDGDLSAAWSKLEGYAARLALVIHLVRWVTGEAEVEADRVDLQSITAGVELARWFGYEARRIYAMLQETQTDRRNRELVERIRRHGGTVTVRDVMRSARDYPTSEAAERALQELVHCGIGRWEESPPAPAGGRPTRRFVLADGADADETFPLHGNLGVLSAQPREVGAAAGAPAARRQHAC